MIWFDNFKGENLSVKLMEVSPDQKELVKRYIQGKFKAYFKKQPCIRENPNCDDYLFIDYPVHSIVFDDEHDHIAIFRENKAGELPIFECLTPQTKGLSFPALDLLGETRGSGAIERMKTAFYALKCLLDNMEEHENAFAGYDFLFIEYLKFFQINPEDKSFKPLIHKAHQMYEKAAQEIMQPNQAVLSNAFSTWRSAANETIVSQRSDISPKFTFINHSFIQLNLCLGIGPDTGLTILIWAKRYLDQKFECTTFQNPVTL